MTRKIKPQNEFLEQTETQMTNRRDFLRNAGMGIIGAGVASCTGTQASDPKSKIEKSEDGYATGVETMKATRKLEQIKIKVTPPLHLPFNSQSTPEEKGSGANFFRDSAFEQNPFTINCGGISGSPVIIDAKGKFVGFMTTYAFEGSIFRFDGKETLTIDVPEGQELYIDESGKGDEAWMDYNAIMMKRLNFKPFSSASIPDFWKDVEYCTWVEQKKQSKIRRGHFKLLTHDFVKDYLDKIISYGYPKGKMTLDHGWGLFPDGSIESGFGSWIPDSKSFPDFHKTMDMIRHKGFTPGLWIAFPKIHHESTYAKRYPDMLGDWRAGKPTSAKAERWLNPKADIYEYASEVIDRYYKLGVMKFKIDMSYNRKSDMLHIHKELYRAAKAIDQNIEMEFHVPDIFFGKHTDTLRTNDIWINEKYDWPSRVKMHYEVTMKSVPGRGINLDHIGGNDSVGINEELWLSHLEMYKDKKGYPLVSLLPHHVSQNCIDKTGDYLWDYDKNGQDILSDFYNKKKLAQV